MDRKRELLTELDELKKQLSFHKTRDSAFKILLNGTFGKTSSRFSVLYNPKLMLATTLTGQLSILMLIELFERGGIHVVSANTDGIVVKCPRDKEDLQRRIVKVWEKATNLETEETDYRSIHSRDVNSYIAVKTDGSTKSKGFFALPSNDRERLAKSPQNDIAIEAAVQYLAHGISVEQTIRACTDIRRFLSLRRVTGGGEKDGEYLGKVVRWYYSSWVDGTITYRKDGKRVPRTRGARPLMVLPNDFPLDVNYDWYIAEAREMLMGVGAIPRPMMPKLPRRNSKVWKALEEQGLVEVNDDGKPQWAVGLEQLPEEYKVTK